MSEKTKISIITDDSGVKLPKTDGEKPPLGKGKNLSEIEELNKILDKNNMPIPSDDLEKEDIYKDILKDFVRPGIFMFAGMFKGVRTFYFDLKEKYDTDLYIISGRYGLIHCEKEIVPYQKHLKNRKDLEELNNNTNLIKKLNEIAEKYDFIVIALPKHITKYLIEQGFFEKPLDNTKITVISSKDFEDELQNENINLLYRKGVARISHDQREKIMNNFRNFESMKNG